MYRIKAPYWHIIRFTRDSSFTLQWLERGFKFDFCYSFFSFIFSFIFCLWYARRVNLFANCVHKCVCVYKDIWPIENFNTMAHVPW